jgi:hypothetical protein
MHSAGNPYLHRIHSLSLTQSSLSLVTLFYGATMFTNTIVFHGLTRRTAYLNQFKFMTLTNIIGKIISLFLSSLAVSTVTTHFSLTFLRGGWWTFMIMMRRHGDLAFVAEPRPAGLSFVSGFL